MQVTSLALGLGLDYAIHLVQRLRQDAVARPGESLEKLLGDALAETGTALSASASTTAAGFMVLALAPMPLFHTFGPLMALTIVLALLSALGGLPGLVLKLGRFSARPATAPR